MLTTDNGTKHADFTYGVDGKRFRMDTKTGSTLLSSKVYIGNNEFGYNNAGTLLYKRTFISTPTGICAVYEDNGSSQTISYVHTNYQGSWLAISDASGHVADQDRFSYDAWGRPRNPLTWAVKTIGVAAPFNDLIGMQPRFDRGYTGHEMLCGFGLINMNGRLYDPYLQRFLSPDNVVQAPDNAQSYNRYTYCLNNPLRYTDPSGYTWWSHFTGWTGEHWKPIAATVATAAIITAGILLTGGASAVLIGAAMNVGSQALAGNIHSYTDFMCAGGVGALTGLASAGMGAWAASASQAIGAFAGATIGAGAGALTGAISGGLSQGLNHALLGAKGSWVDGMIGGAITGGIMGGISGGIQGYQNAKAIGAKPWTGSKVVNMRTYSASGYGNPANFIQPNEERDWFIPIKPEPKRDAKGRFTR